MPKKAKRKHKPSKRRSFKPGADSSSIHEKPIVEPASSEEKRAYEERLQRRLKLLRQYFEEDKIKIAEGLNVADSLMAVRYAPDGSVDLNTVDGLVRSLALAIEASHEREELKKAISLSEIQNLYFKFLDDNFGFFYKIMLERGLTPHQAGLAATKSNIGIEEITKPLPQFLKTIEEFWTGCGEAAHVHVEDMHKTLKGVFGGDLFPSWKENIASKCGLYADTIILPDPFLRTKHVFQRGQPKDHAYYLMKHALNLLQYRELACADVKPPIVVILPDMASIDKREFDFIRNLGTDDALTHAGRIFGRKFGNVQELLDFANGLDTLDKIESQIADPSRVLANIRLQGDWKDQIREAQGKTADLLAVKSPGIVVASMALGRMNVSSELLFKARRLRGTPIIDAPTSWQYFVWKLEYDAEKIEKEANLQNLHVLRGLQSLAENEMVWLGKVPPEALIEMRKTQAIDEIRSILGKGVDQVAQTNPTNFFRTTDQVFDNIQKAFDDHRTKIKKLSDKKWKFAGSDIGSWLVTGTLAIAAAATGHPTFGIAAYAASEVLNAPKLREIPKTVAELARQDQELKRSPVALLFKLSGE